jgi:transcriptional regulator with XRE-family HTH domain
MKIGGKIKAFGIKQFGSVTEFAKALGMEPQNLYDYFSKGIMPGAEFLMELKKMGCDMNWLLSEEEDSPALVKEPAVEYKVNQLEKENEELKEEADRLKNIIMATAVDLQNQLKSKKKNISDRWKKPKK